MYQIPPSATHQGHRADSWNVEKWLRAVRVKVTSRGSKGAIKLEDKDSGELFAECPLPNDAPVSTAVEPVIDSSRYFVLRVVDESSGRHAFLGLGFRERDHASDFKLAVQEHQNARAREREAIKRREEHERLMAEKAAANAAAGVEGPAKLHDYSLKGTVTVNIPRRATGGAKSVNGRGDGGRRRRRPPRRETPAASTTGVRRVRAAAAAGGHDARGRLRHPAAAAAMSPAVSPADGPGTAPVADASTIIRSPTAGTGLNSGVGRRPRPSRGAGAGRGRRTARVGQTSTSPRGGTRIGQTFSRDGTHPSGTRGWTRGRTPGATDAGDGWATRG